MRFCLLKLRKNEEFYMVNGELKNKRKGILKNFLNYRKCHLLRTNKVYRKRGLFINKANYSESLSSRNYIYCRLL